MSACHWGPFDSTEVWEGGRNRDRDIKISGRKLGPFEVGGSWITAQRKNKIVAFSLWEEIRTRTWNGGA